MKPYFTLLASFLGLPSINRGTLPRVSTKLAYRTPFAAKIIGVLALLLPLPILAQNVRWDLPVYTVQAQGGNLLPVYAIPGAGVKFYACSGSTCTTLATTYISATSSTTCPTSPTPMQVTLNGTSACVPNADPYGNMGAWFQNGQYMATITAPGNSFNYFFTIGGAGGSGGNGIIAAWPDMYWPGIQTVANQIFASPVVAPQAVTFASGCPNSYAQTIPSAVGDAAPTATGSVAWTMADLAATSSPYCTFTWSASGSVATVTGGGGVLAAGHTLVFIGSSSPDATLANVVITPGGTTNGGGGGSSGSAITALTNDVLAAGPGSAAATVKGLDGVPFCNGFTPTNGQAVEYTTGSSPDPCYTAATAGITPEILTASNSTELDFTSCFSTSHTDYQVRLSGMEASSSAFDIYIQYSTNGGSTWDTAATNYIQGGRYMQLDGGASNDWTGGFGSINGLDPALNPGNGQVTWTDIDMTIHNPDTSGSMSGFTALSDLVGADGRHWHVTSGGQYAVGSVNAFRVVAMSTRGPSSTVIANGLVSGIVTCQPLQ